jgi:hypothetical protein
MDATTEFLTPEECAEVDKALLTSKDKFAARVAIYSLRSLKEISAESGSAITDLTHEQIEDWIYQDSSLQGGIDSEFKRFFTQLVISSMRPLNQVGQDAGLVIGDLTVPQVVSWFEKQAKIRLGQ